MDRTRFSAIVEAYGAEPRRWPAVERDAAAAFVAEDPGVEADLADARRLEHWLDANVTPEPSAASRRRIVEAAPRGASWRWALNWWAPGAGLAAAAVAGVVAGSSLLGPDPRVDVLLAEAEAYDVATLMDVTAEEAR